MALSFTSTIVQDCRTGNGLEGYSIVYPYHGSSPDYGFHPIYHAGDGTQLALGYTGDIETAKMVCQIHYDNTHPST